MDDERQGHGSALLHLSASVFYTILRLAPVLGEGFVRLQVALLTMANEFGGSEYIELKRRILPFRRTIPVWTIVTIATYGKRTLKTTKLTFKHGKNVGCQAFEMELRLRPPPP